MKAVLHGTALLINGLALGRLLLFQDSVWFGYV